MVNILFCDDQTIKVYNKKYLKHNSTSIILDKIFQNNIEEKQFNFHGSNLSEIAEFYRRFGAKEEQYAFIKHNKKQLLTYISPFT